MFINKDKKSNYIFVFFYYILFLGLMNSFLFLQAIVSWFHPSLFVLKKALLSNACLSSGESIFAPFG
jgi:hypothetical protein